MAKNSLNRVERNIEICCSEITEIPLKIFKLPFNIVHVMFTDQYSVIPVFKIYLLNREKDESATYLPTFENSKSYLFHILGNLGIQHGAKFKCPDF